MTRRVIGSSKGSGPSEHRGARSTRSAPRGTDPQAADSHKGRTGKDDHPSRSVRSKMAGQGERSSGTSDPGIFVDARELTSHDMVAHALQQSAGGLGVASRPKIVDFNERLREKRRANIQVIALRFMIGVVAAALCGVVIWLLFFSPVLRLETDNITISGTNAWVGKDRIMQIASKQAGRSLLLISTDDVVTQLQDIPGVTKAQASRNFPRGMHVEVSAQKPAAMLKTADRKLTAVDGQGRILNAVQGVSDDGIPVIDVDDVQRSLKDRAVQDALTILSGLPENMRQHITKVSARTQDSITTELNGGQRVIVWGDDSDLALKMAVVDKIINDPSKIGDKHNVDVSAPLRPIIK